MRHSYLQFCFSLGALVFTATFAPAAGVTTLPATGFSEGTATLNAMATLSGGTSYFGYFEYGLTPNYGSETGDQILGGGTGTVDFNQLVTGLASNQIYHFRADLFLLVGGTIQGN